MQAFELKEHVKLRLRRPYRFLCKMNKVRKLTQREMKKIHTGKERHNKEAQSLTSV